MRRLSMFSAVRRVKARTAAKAMLHQTLSTLTSPFGEKTVPGWIYEDPYVLGYLMFLAFFAIDLATLNKLLGDDRSKVAIQALAHVAGANWRVAVENAGNFYSERNEAFLEGLHRADRCVGVAYGVLGPEHDIRRSRSTFRMLRRLVYRPHSRL